MRVLPLRLSVRSKPVTAEQELELPSGTQELVASSFAALLAGPAFAEGFSRDDFLADVKIMRKRLRARRRGLLNP